ncbi:MAG: class I tRNA ligase family protein, partial [Nitrososphaerales archaeon]|nr:class I tRNA ligase family protein [Nitrososphaerales archaeon]
SAKPEFGSGAAMICSYGDYTDVLLFRELGLKEIIAIDEDGKITDVGGIIAGLKVVEARKKIIDELNRKGLITKVEEIKHRTPVCERSGTPIEIIPMKEYYLKQIDLVPTLKNLAKGMIFHPEVHRQILLDWLDSIKIDWAISRRRYYATEIPVWYCKKCGEPHVPEPGPYYRPWKDKPPFKRCRRCDGEEFVGDSRTLDTWVDSSISPLYISKYLKDERLFNILYPTTLRPQAKDIIRTWLHYTILRCYQLTNKAPFKHVWIMGYGVDEKGERMSKSKGNVIDPIPILKKYGADTFRFWAASEARLGSDFRCSEKKIATVKNFLTKLWNISRFISSFPQPTEANLTPSDRWILGELSKLIDECLEGYRDFDFYIPSNKIREFSWNLFAAHYIEMVKPRAYGLGFSGEEQSAAWYTLHTCLRTILLLSAPIIPFITECIWQSLYSSESIHKQTFPKAEWDTKLTSLTKVLIDFNSKVWNMKKERGLSLRSQIHIEIPSELKIFERDLKAMHNIV